MRLTEYIRNLQEILEAEGELMVTTSIRGRVVDAKPPSVEYTAELKPRESVERYWYMGMDREKIHKLVRV